MRRSAAPSQLAKRASFTPPFINPPAKRPCIESANNDVSTNVNVKNNEPKCDNNGKVRSTTEILSLLKKPSKQFASPVLQSKDENVYNKVKQDSNGTETPNFKPNCQTNEISSSWDRPNFCSPVSNLNTNSVIGSRPVTMPSTKPVSTGVSYGTYKPPAITSKAAAADENQAPVEERYYSIVWCKRSNKKHKNWEGDAVLIVKGRSVTIKDMEGKTIGQSSGFKLKDLATLEEGNTLPVGGKEVEIQGVISASSYISGKCFQGHSVTATDESPLTPVPVRPKPKPFRLPTLGRVNGSLATPKETDPLYNASAPDALVLPKPPSHHQFKYNSEGLNIIDVVVDPLLANQLRPHQKEGVIFLYECVLGYRVSDRYGAILADEMGLGKTLQCISLVWTLLKQGPYGRKPMVKKVLIVTPSSLTNNWGKEFNKWLGRERIRVYIVDQNNRVELFATQQQAQIMIISYEMFMRSAEFVATQQFDLLLCDEGHRLKNSNIKTTSLLLNLPCKKRIILTGTPLQNDLQELFALIDFVNPGVLGTSSSFRRIYEDPIVAAQQPNAAVSEKEIGTSRASELNRINSLFTLRRTQDVIDKYLPPKVENVIFCQPSEVQISVYEGLTRGRSIRQCLMSHEQGDHLSAIMAMKKLCNHPGLLAKKDKDAPLNNQVSEEAAALLPQHVTDGEIFSEQDSGKLAVVSCLLWALSEQGNEKIVLVSNYTSTLDMLATLCDRYNYGYLRLDGSTQASKRQHLVDKFNNKYSEESVFLLSAKAGGVGLNLIGASRILLYDIDWNPATDLQAMARVWRDGQQRKVHIYRLLLAGTIDEKIYQRQIRKQGLSGAVVDARDSAKGPQFSTEELKDLFSLNYESACGTHDLLGCQCDLMGGTMIREQEEENQNSQRDCQLASKSGGISKHKSSSTTMDQLYNWQHYQAPFTDGALKDPCLEAAQDFITFVFRSEGTHTTVTSLE